VNWLKEADDHSILQINLREVDRILSPTKQVRLNQMRKTKEGFRVVGLKVRGSLKEKKLECCPFRNNGQAQTVEKTSKGNSRGQVVCRLPPEKEKFDKGGLLGEMVEFT